MGRKTKRPREGGEAPKKCDFRQRAHSNPLADAGRDHPSSPRCVDWHASFPAHFAPLLPGGQAPPAEDGAPEVQKEVEWVDIGCGYGGLLMAMAPAFPEKLMLGLEIRDKVSQFAHEKIVSLRAENPGSYQNCDVLKVNAQKHLPQFFRKGQLEKLLFCFPDPHFKKTNYRRRIVTVGLCAEYGYCIREGGHLYTVTDCTELHEWMVRHLEESPMFERLTEAEEQADPVVPFICTRTDESIKVARNQGDKTASVWRRLVDTPSASHGGLGRLSSSCQVAAAARLLTEARVSGRGLTTVDAVPVCACLPACWPSGLPACLPACGRPRGCSTLTFGCAARWLGVGFRRRSSAARPRTPPSGSWSGWWRRQKQRAAALGAAGVATTAPAITSPPHRPDAQPSTVPSLGESWAGSGWKLRW